MKSLRQLLRRPFKSLLGVLLLALSGAFLCLTLGQYASALQTRDQVGRTYTTLALTTDQYQVQDFLDEDGNPTGTEFLNSLPFEMQQWLDGLQDAHPEVVRARYQQGLASAYCPELVPRNLSQYGAAQAGSPYTTPYENAPYTRALLVMTLEEIGELEIADSLIDTTGEVDGYQVALSGRVEEAVGLQEGFRDPVGRTLRVTLRVPDQEYLAALELQPGARYLVYGRDYLDTDWQLRRDLAIMYELRYEDIDWDYLSLSDPTLEGPMESEYVAIYYSRQQGSKYDALLTQYELDQVDACSLTVFDPTSLKEQHSVTDPETGEWSMELRSDLRLLWTKEGEVKDVPLAEYQAMYQPPTLVRLEGSAEEFLASPQGALWKQALENLQINNQSFPVIGTPLLESLAQFGRQEANLVSGRSFLPEEYRQGSRVCVLSETLAAANGLAVGDTISLRFYDQDLNLPGQDYSGTINPAAAYYSHVYGFAGEAEEYQIVGLYRQKQQWSSDRYAFTPNTIFVPRQALHCQVQETGSGVLSTLVLENGQVDAMEALLEEAGYEGLLVYYDQGYAAVQGSLEAYFSISRVVTLVGLGAWLGILILFLALFPGRQGADLARMRALGAQPRQLLGHLLASSMGLAALGVLLGGILGACLLGNVIDRILKAAAEAEGSLVAAFQIVQSPLAVPVVAAAQVVMYLVIFTLFGAVFLRRFRGMGGKGRA